MSREYLYDKTSVSCWRYCCRSHHGGNRSFSIYDTRWGGTYEMNSIQDGQGVTADDAPAAGKVRQRRSLMW